MSIYKSHLHILNKGRKIALAEKKLTFDTGKLLHFHIFAFFETCQECPVLPKENLF